MKSTSGCFFILLILFFTFTKIDAQQLSLKGKVLDKIDGSTLSFANIRISNSSIGTAANTEGDFELRLKPDTYTIIISFIGYKSDSIKVNLTTNKNLMIPLERISINLPEVTVLPKENPANEIIRRAMKAKKEREEKLDSYIFRAYTKGLIKTTKNISASDRRVSLGIATRDTGALKITGIIENESIGYFQKPSSYKDEILAQKQSSNTPSSINILTGGRLIQNFYSDDIQFFGKPLTSPISEDALDYYYFDLKDTLAYDNRAVYQIYFETQDRSDPGFYGTIYIADKTFNLEKLEVSLNRAANPGGIFDFVNIFQQFQLYKDNISMPIDYRIFAEGNVLGIAKFGFELNSIFFDYDINTKIPEDKFDMAVIKVLPGADKKDSTYWENTQTIPNTLEEIEAYARIDSVESVPRTFWDNFSFLSMRVNLNDNLSFTGPVGLYHFNRIEGHSLDFGLFGRSYFDKRLNWSTEFSYGFSDNKFKQDLNAQYYFGEYRTGDINFDAYNKLTDLFGESTRYNRLTSTALSWITKVDFRDYYYTKGFNFSVNEQVFPFLNLGVGFFYREDKNAYNNSDFSLFNRSKTYRENRLITPVNITAITASFTLDFRNYIEDGYFRRRVAFGEPFFLFSGEIISSEGFLDNLYTQYNSNFYAYLPSYRSTNFVINTNLLFSDGRVPIQMMRALAGNIESAGKNFTFRTLRIGEVFGDQVFSLNVEHNINDELFRFLSIPVLKDLQLLMSFHFNMGWSLISNMGKEYNRAPFQDGFSNPSFNHPIEFKQPIMEVGFGIGQILIPMKMEFTWKLTHLGHNNFVISVNTIVL
ncbi:MAG: DUF5686 and carboxypeptidase regulatory-like domain-containing protein [Melioribacteraceae bacterium]|nr:DUF5686 and carboxypeptidase regulatory-like domain-containing protein [Melioribacteraceae bacterium]